MTYTLKPRKTEDPQYLKARGWFVASLHDPTLYTIALPTRNRIRIHRWIHSNYGDNSDVTRIPLTIARTPSGKQGYCIDKALLSLEFIEFFELYYGQTALDRVYTKEEVFSAD